MPSGVYKHKPHSEEAKRKMRKNHPPQMGRKNPNWRGGTTPKNKIIRCSIESRLWRESVFAKDNWTCQKCGARNGNGKEICLHPHHIKNFAEYPELRFAIDNGITFCKKCHEEFHKRYGRKNNTKKQVEEFIRK